MDAGLRLRPLWESVCNRWIYPSGERGTDATISGGIQRVDESACGEQLRRIRESVTGCWGPEFHVRRGESAVEFQWDGGDLWVRWRRAAGKEDGWHWDNGF